MDLFLWSGSRRRVGELVLGTPPRPPGPRVHIECGSGDDLKVADETNDDNTEHDNNDIAEPNDYDNAELGNNNDAKLELMLLMMLNLMLMKNFTCAKAPRSSSTPPRKPMALIGALESVWDIVL